MKRFVFQVNSTNKQLATKDIHNVIMNNILLKECSLTFLVDLLAMDSFSFDLSENIFISSFFKLFKKN